jgi:hypothetical protein
MSAVREQVAPGDYLTRGVVIAYDSYTPAVDRETVAQTGAEAEEVS